MRTADPNGERAQRQRAVANLLRSAALCPEGATRMMLEARAEIARGELSRWDQEHAPDVPSDGLVVCDPDWLLAVKSRSRWVRDQLAATYAWRRAMSHRVTEQVAELRVLRQESQLLRRCAVDLLAGGRGACTTRSGAWGQQPP